MIMRKYTGFDEIKADEYRYWQSRPVHERLDAVDDDDRNGLCAQRLGD